MNQRIAPDRLNDRFLALAVHRLDHDVLPANTTLSPTRAPTPTDRVRHRRAEDRYGELAAFGACTHPADMFVVTEAEAAAIRAVYEQRGEFSAAVELRRLFPGVTDTTQARACAGPLPAGRYPSRVLSQLLDRFSALLHGSPSLPPPGCQCGAECYPPRYPQRIKGVPFEPTH